MRCYGADKNVALQIKIWGIKELRLGAQEILKEKIDGKDRTIRLGAIWKGKKPDFRNLRWIVQ